MKLCNRENFRKYFVNFEKTLSMKQINSFYVIFSVVIIFVIFLSGCMKKQKVDMIITHATIYTCDSVFSTVESMAVKDGYIVATGSSDEILRKFKSDNIIEAKGKFIYPGFYDAHCHFLGYGLNKELYADLSSAHSEAEAIELLKAFHEKKKNYWILGRGWNQNNWPGSIFPDTKLLDKYFPENPVFLIRVDGHAAWVNSKAMQIAGITAQTHCEGGAILVRKGKPMGILLDEAMELVRKHIPLPDHATKIKALLSAQKDCFENGITSIADAGLSVEDILLIDSLHQSTDLQIKIYAMLDPFSNGFEDFVNKGIYQTDQLTVRSFKLYADGALGSRGACLLEPYLDDPDNYGLIIHNKEIIEKFARLAKDKGFQMCVHAIGDSANRMVLHVYAMFLEPGNDLRWRIEHAQVLHPDDISKFDQFNIIPSIQSTHATSDMYWAEERLGIKRLQFAYATKKLLEQNGWLCNGTDFPVEQMNPFLTFYAAITRQDVKGFPEGGFLPEQLLSRQEALLSMTLWAAKAAFEEQSKGRIEAGKVADFIILNEDLMTVDVRLIPYITVKATYVNGHCVFRSKYF